jgi:hypothetical protein
MILVLSGEGPTDLGTQRLEETGWEFVPGPMAWIIDKLLERPGKLGPDAPLTDRLNFSILQFHADYGGRIYFLNKGELSALHYPRTKSSYLPRAEDTPGNQYHKASAYQLGRHAQTVAIERNEAAIAVFFRDFDGTNTTPRTEWEGKFNSMKQGFARADFQSGVPMVPRPKSEAWILCGLRKREDASRDCSGLEDEPGNDVSPKSLKGQLAKHLKYEPTAERQAELVSSGQIDPALIDLPSFIAFHDELDRAYAHAAPPLK